MADAGHRVAILAGRGSQTDPRVAFVGMPLLDSRHPDVLAVKAVLDGGYVPESFHPLVARIQDDLARSIAGADWLIAHNVCSLNKNLALTAALKRLSETKAMPRLILWHHDLAWLTPRYRSELYDGYPWDLLRVDWPGAIQVTVSETRRGELAELLGMSPERIQVVPNGLDVSRFLKLEAGTVSFIKQLDLLGVAPLLLLPVRITRRKNIELALHILAALRTRFPRASLVVTGPLGPHNPANVEYFEELCALRRELGLEGAAHFLAELSPAFLPDEVVSDFYHLADALLFPSREEGFGIPILEAGLAGIPIFCADIPQLRELGGGHVTYFSPDVESALVARQIAEYLDASPIYAFRERVRNVFTWERVFSEKIAPMLETKGRAGAQSI
jgi:glycosyltransferase involved in cell wall biosynthesis